MVMFVFQFPVAIFKGPRSRYVLECLLLIPRNYYAVKNALLGMYLYNHPLKFVINAQLQRASFRKTD